MRFVGAAQHDSRALVDAGLDVALHPLLLALRDKRPDVGRLVGGIAHLQTGHHLRERVDDLVVLALADQNAGLRHARLPVVHQAGHLQMLDGVIDVGVIEDDRRRLAAQLEADPLELFAADRGDVPAGRRRTGERDLVHARMANQALAGLPPPGTIDTTPSGRSISSSISANHMASKGVSGAGLTTTVQPAINAGIIFGMIRNCGTFHGTIAPTTPTGARRR